MPTVLYGITGGIAAYKAPDVVRQLKKLGFDVVVAMTEKAKWFVTPQTLQTLSENKVYDALIDEDSTIVHLELVRRADILLIAPATANSIAKYAQGLADDLLSNIALSFQGPKLIAPAMHTEMVDNPATQRNLPYLRETGWHIVGPADGELACGDVGKGRMVEPALLALATQTYLRLNTCLTGRKIVITAGGTVERIDNVRVITNLSSAKWGHQLAQMASLLGADVTLITTKPVIENPNLTVVTVESVADLAAALQVHYPDADALYMMAAVSDYTVEQTTEKIRRGELDQLKLIPTQDILASLEKREECKVIGFCLEPGDRIQKATEKMAKKRCDVIIANHPDMIGQDTRSFEILFQAGDKQQTYENVTLTEACAALLGLLI